MGLILLIGLVVKNGIVLIDFAHQPARGRRAVPARRCERAARMRLRPILMTTLCTLFGLLPLALGLGAGAELQKPLALRRDRRPEAVDAGAVRVAGPLLARRDATEHGAS